MILLIDKTNHKTPTNCEVFINPASSRSNAWTTREQGEIASEQSCADGRAGCGWMGINSMLPLFTWLLALI